MSGHNDMTSKEPKDRRVGNKPIEQLIHNIEYVWLLANAQTETEQETGRSTDWLTNYFTTPPINTQTNTITGFLYKTIQM